jgi:predicted site-specific integrase-resolvase
MSQLKLPTTKIGGTELIPLHEWAKFRGVTLHTTWRWRKRGHINPVNLHGKLYLKLSDAEEWERRALNNEFAMVQKPSKKRK